MPLENIEQAIYISAPSDLSGIKKDYFSRVYYGAEFCENLIPAPAETREVAGYAESSGLGLSFLTPYCSNAGLKKVEKSLAVLPAGTEVIFNDFGVLKRIREMGLANLRLVLGRMLVKYKRDPRITKLSAAQRVTEYLASSNINMGEFQRFLLASRIKRIEIENSFQGYNFRLDRNIRTSLYYPYVYIATAIRCVFKAALNLPDCGRCCKGPVIKSAAKGVPTDIITRGNTEFYFNGRLKSHSCLKRLNVDRLVFFARPPF